MASRAAVRSVASVAEDRQLSPRDMPAGTVKEPTFQRLRTVPQLAALCPGVSEYAIREWIRHSRRNGLEAAICRPSGNRIYVDLHRFEAWLEGKFGPCLEGDSEE